jgi:hypothetical protein
MRNASQIYLLAVLSCVPAVLIVVHIIESFWARGNAFESSTGSWILLSLMYMGLVAGVAYNSLMSIHKRLAELEKHALEQHIER